MFLPILLSQSTTDEETAISRIPEVEPAIIRQTLNGE
jgi:hypothetical protein